MSVDGSPTADGPDPNAVEIETCFLVIVNKEGGSAAILDPNARFNVRRQATAQDIYPAVANVAADFQAAKTAEAVMGFQMQMARQAESQQIMQRVQQGAKVPWVPGMPGGPPNQR